MTDYLSLLVALYAYGIDFESNTLNEFNLIYRRINK